MKLGEAYIEVTAKTAGLRGQFKKAQGITTRAATRAAASFTKAFGRGLRHFGRDIGRHLKRGLKIATAAAIGGLTLSIRQAAKFEYQMAKVSSMLLGKSMEWMPRLTRGVQDLAVEWAQGTDVLSDGLYNILSSSIPVDKSLKMLWVTARAAAGGFTDVATVTKATTTILKAYQLETERAADVTDWLQATVFRGRADFGELAANIGDVAATAANAGVSLEDLGAGIASMTRVIATPEAMTALNNTLMQFYKVNTPEATRAARKYGIELNTTWMRAHGLVEMMRRMSRAQEEEIATMFPMMRGLKGLGAWLAQLNEIGNDTAAMFNRMGGAEEAAGKAADTAAFKMRAMRESISQVLVTFGDVFLGDEKKAADATTKTPSKPLPSASANGCATRWPGCCAASAPSSKGLECR